MSSSLLRILHFDKEILLNIDERIDLSQALIAATYRQLAIASNCLLTIYNLSSILLNEEHYPNIYDVITTPSPILALTSTIDRIIYVYHIDQLKICSIPSQEQDLTIVSFDNQKKIHLCSTDDGNVFIGYESKIFSLTQFHYAFDSTIVKISSGKEHVLVLLEDGRLFTWGNGLHGALGLGDLEPCPQPTQIEALGNDVIDTVAGGWHSLGKHFTSRICIDYFVIRCLALLSDGSVMSWGWNNDGSLGLQSDDEDDNSGVFCEPTLATCIPLGVDCRAISAGARHSAFIGTNDRIWLCGSNKHGQLGNQSSFAIEKNTRVFCSSWFTVLY